MLCSGGQYKMSSTSAVPLITIHKRKTMKSSRKFREKLDHSTAQFASFLGTKST